MTESVTFKKRSIKNILFEQFNLQEMILNGVIWEKKLRFLRKKDKKKTVLVISDLHLGAGYFFHGTSK